MNDQADFSEDANIQPVPPNPTPGPDTTAAFESIVAHLRTVTTAERGMAAAETVRHACTVTILDVVDQLDNPADLARLLAALREARDAAKAAEEACENRLARLLPSKVWECDDWTVERRQGSSRVEWDLDMTVARVRDYLAESGEHPLDAVLRLGRVEWRSTALRDSGISTDNLKRSEPGRTRIILTPKN